MNKLLLLSALLPMSTMGQTLAGTEPENRIALLEKYGWVECGWCPDGDAIIDELVVEHGNALIPVTMHGGSSTDPLDGHPDFRTPWSDSLFLHYGITGWPRGVINRLDYNGAAHISRSQWAAAVEAMLALPSPVNVGLSSSFEAGTREMTATVELYYTADSPGPEDRLQVLIKESHIIGFQQDYINGPHAAFDHKHILRAYLTPVWGEVVQTTTQGTLVQRTFTFTLPEEWVVENCEVVAFVGEGQNDVYQVRAVEVDGGFTTALQQEPAGSDERLHTYPVPAVDRVVIAVPPSTTGSDLRVLDATGRVVHVQRITMAGTLELGTGWLANGTYTLMIHNGNKSHRGTMLVQH